MIANPYDIYARNILRLEPLPAVGTEPGAALYGTLVHEALRAFAVSHPTTLPADICVELLAVADKLFSGKGGSARVEAFWRPSFERFARWFAETEPLRRTGIARIEAEVDGALDIETANPLPAHRPRRSHRFGRGWEHPHLRLQDLEKCLHRDYVDDLFAPQLPLEAAIAAGGGFAGLACGPSPRFAISAPRGAAMAAPQAMRGRARRISREQRALPCGC